MTHRHNVYDLLGVSGPGDGWSSSGPGGMTSAQVQSGQTVQPSGEAGFWDGWFEEEKPMVAEGGAVTAATDQVFDNMFDGEGDIQWGQPVSHGGGGGGSSAASPAPSGSIPGSDPVPASGVASKSTLTTAIIVGAVVGAGYFLLK